MEKSITSANEKVNVSNHIPDDIAFSILSKLPLKSLKRFESVSKPWSMLFRNSYFMKIYRNHIIHGNHPDYDHASVIVRQMVPISYVDRETDFYLMSDDRFENRVKMDISLPSKELGQNLVIVGSISINGILCVCSTATKERKIVLWNPATEEMKVIPRSPVESSFYRRAKPRIHAFGYDYVRGDYKLIRYVQFDVIRYEDDDMSWHKVPLEPLWEMYSLSSNSWRVLDVKMPPLIVPLCDVEMFRVYMDGMCHWWTQEESHLEHCYNSHLVSFDLINEVFFTTPMPSDLYNEFSLEAVECQLVMLNGHIALLQYYGEMTTFQISILGELCVEKSWTKIFSVRLSSSVRRPIGAAKKGNIYFAKEDGEMVHFDLDTQMMEELGVKGWNCQMVIYKESLLSI
jgi:molecular chaperone HtpG